MKHGESKSQPVEHEIVVLAENIHNPVNMGMIFRVCEAMAVKELIFTGGKIDSNNRKLIRAARNTTKEVPSRWIEGTEEALQELKSKGYQLVGLEITNDSKDIRHVGVKAASKIALVIGSERFGVDNPTLKSMDFNVHIPMFGKNLSLNVVSALSIALFELIRQMNT